MKLGQSAVGLSALSLVALAALGGCKNEVTTGATVDPLTGDWSSSACFGSEAKPADVESCKTTLSFTRDLNFELTAEWVSLSATAKNPGCTTTKRVTGQEWSTDHAAGTITLTGTGRATMERTKCVDVKDNSEPAPTTDISIPSGRYDYTLNGNTLNINSGPLRGAYNR